MKPHDSDEQLMRRLAGDDRSALAQLMKRWQGPLWCFIDRLLGPAGSTDEVYQDVWVRLYRYRSSCSSVRTFRAYLFRIAVNCCRTEMSRERYMRARYRSFEDLPGEVDPSNDDPTPLETMIVDEQCLRLRRAIDRLPEMQRTIVLLYLYTTTDYGHIASMVERRPGTVRSHMHHALSNLRNFLDWESTKQDSEANGERQVRHEK